MRSLFVGLAVAGALLGCSSSNDLSSSLKLSLDTHQALWGQRTFSSYQFDLDQLEGGVSTSVHVTVNGTTVVSVIDTTTGQPPAGGGTYPSIDDLFASAQAAFGKQNTTLQMEFNEPLGYPTLTQINSPDPASPFSWQVSHLVPIE